MKLTSGDPKYSGLTSAEVKTRIEKDGYNELQGGGITEFLDDYRRSGQRTDVLATCSLRYTLYVSGGY